LLGSGNRSLGDGEGRGGAEVYGATMLLCFAEARMADLFVRLGLRVMFR
jgi:hypothetical protein